MHGLCRIDNLLIVAVVLSFITPLNKDIFKNELFNSNNEKQVLFRLIIVQFIILFLEIEPLIKL